MSNPLKKTMVFLGLAEEDLEEPRAESTSPTPAPQAERAQPETESAQRPQPQRAPVTPLRKVTPTRAANAHPMNEILTVQPTKYSDAPSIAENFREGVPVILNLSQMQDDDAQRLIDFASGLAMGLRGRIERVTSKVFLLSPEHIAVSSEEHEGEESGSFFVSSGS